LADEVKFRCVQEVHLEKQKEWKKKRFSEPASYGIPERSPIQVQTESHVALLCYV
jgi:hypothetical protein